MNIYTFYTALRLSVAYSFSSIQRKQHQFFIGLLSVISIVLFSALLSAILEVSPILFLRFSETTAGETDIVVTRESGSSNPLLSSSLSVLDDDYLPSSTGTENAAFFTNILLNHTDLWNHWKNGRNPRVRGAVPRWMAIASVSPVVTNDGNNENREDDDGSSSSSSSSSATSTVIPTTNAFILAIDSRLEKEISLGRAWTHRSLGMEEAHVTSTVLNTFQNTGYSIQPNTGQRIKIQFSFATLFNTLIGNGGGGTTNTARGGTSSSSLTNSTTTSSSSTVDPLLLLFINQLLGINNRPASSASSNPNNGNYVDLPIATATSLGIFLSSNNLFDLQGQPLINLTALLLTTPPEVLRQGNVRIPTTPIVQALLYQSLSTLLNSENSDLFAVEAAVIDNVPSPQGKWPSVLGNVVIIDARYANKIVQSIGLNILNVIEQRLNPFFTLLTTIRNNPVTSSVQRNQIDSLLSLSTNLEQTHRSIQAFDYAQFRQYAMSVHVMWQEKERAWYFARNRIEGDPNGITGFANSLIGGNDLVSSLSLSSTGGLGHTSRVDLDTPLADVLDNVLWRIFGLFLDQILRSSIFVLCTLGTLVVYALVVGDIEEARTELGMLRALGMNKLHIGMVLIIQTLSFALPGIALGLIGSSILYRIGITILSNFIALPNLGNLIASGNQLPLSSFTLSITLGILTPSIAILVPLRTTIGSSLRDALDIYRSSLNTITIRIEKLTSLGISFTTFTLALLAVFGGFTIYYILPLAFALRDLNSFLSGMTGILIGMLMGLSITAFTLQPYLELGITYLLTFVTGYRSLYTIIKKNLGGHVNRNQKTAIMFGLSACFLVFASTIFRLQGNALSNAVRMLLGADIVVIVPDSLQSTGLTTGNGNPNNQPQSQPTDYRLPEEQLESLLNPYTVSTSSHPYPLIAGYTFITPPLMSINIVRRTYGSSLAGIPRTMLVNMYGVEENYLDVAYTELMDISESSTSGLRSGFANAPPPSLPNNDNTVSGKEPSVKEVQENTVAALYRGAGKIRLASENTLQQYPLPPTSDDRGSYRSPVYYCYPTTTTESPSSSSSSSSFTKDQLNDYSTKLSINLDQKDLWDLSYARPPPYTSDTVNKTTGNQSISDQLLYNLLLSFRTNEQQSTVRNTNEPRNTTVRVYSTYEGCMLACNDPYIRTVYSQNGNSTQSICRYNVSTLETAFPPLFPYYVITDHLRTNPSFSSSSPPILCGLPSPCLTVQPNTVIVSTPSTQTLPQNTTVSTILDSLHLQQIISTYINYMDILMSEALRPAGAIDINTPLALRLLTWDPESGYSVTTSNLVKSRSLIRKFPGFIFSSYAPTANRSPFIIRMQDYHQLLRYAEQDYQRIRNFVGDERTVTGNDNPRTVQPLPFSSSSNTTKGKQFYDIPKYRLLIKLHKNVTVYEKDMLLNALRSTIGNDRIGVQDTVSVLDGARFAINGLDIFFLLCSFICIYLCFFGAYLSFTANIRYSIIEIGILRSLGLPSTLTTRIYIVEALAVTLAACVNGLGIGILTAVALSLQFNLFVEMPFQFLVSVPLIVVFLLSAAFIAVYASYYPSQPFTKGVISAVVKGRVK